MSLSAQFSLLPLSILQRQHYYFFLTKLTECLMNIQANTNVCVHWLIVSSLFTTRRHTTHLVLYVQEGFEEGCALWTDNFVGAGRRWDNGDWMALCSCRDMAWDHRWNHVLLTFCPGSSPLHCSVSWISGLCMQERTSEVLAGFSEAVCPVSSLKYPLVILHTPLICLINLFLIDYAKVNFESFALEMTKWPNYVKVPAQYLAHSSHFIK